MTIRLLRRLYAPEFFVRGDLRAGEIPPAKEVYSTAFGIAWASILETLLVSLISMADTVMVSVVGDAAIAAVGIVSQPRFLVQTFILALNIAVTSIAARRKGEGDSAGAISCLKQGLILSVLISIITSVIMYPTARPFLLFTGAQAETIGMATDYFRILLIGIPFNSVSLTLCAALRGIGNTRASMTVNLAANIINLIFNYFLIGGNYGFPKLGVSGAAIATAIGWFCGLLLALIAVARKEAFLFLFTREGWRFDRRTLGAMYKVASGSFWEQLCMRAGFFTYAKVIAGLGTLMFAAHQILINILSLSFCFGEGFGIAATSMVGQSMGAKRPDLSIVYGKACQRMSIVTSSAVFLILALLGRSMTRLFTQDPEILRVCGLILYMIGLILFAQCGQMIFMGCLRGAGDTKYVAAISLISIMLLRPAVAYYLAFPMGMGLIGAWFAFFMDQILRLALTVRRFSSGRWMSIKL